MTLSSKKILKNYTQVNDILSQKIYIHDINHDLRNILFSIFNNIIKNENKEIIINNIEIIYTKIEDLLKKINEFKNNKNDIINLLLKQINDNYILLKQIKDIIIKKSKDKNREYLIELINKLELKENILNILNLINILNKKIYIIKSLFNKLEKTRKNIKLNNIYVDEEHKEICNYYNNYLNFYNYLRKNVDLEFINKNKEIIHENYNSYKKSKEKIILKKIYIKININFYNIINNNINRSNTNIIKTIYYNNYNLKFINKILNYDILINYESKLNNFIYKQKIFFNTLSIRELYSLKYYTYLGNELLNLYLQNNFNKENINNLFIISKIINNYHYLLFYYQFLDVFYDIYNNKQQDKYQFLKKTNFDFNQISNKEYFIQYINDNFKLFDDIIFEIVLKKYINDIINIFNKAPIVEDDIICYRGIKENYINENKDLINLKEGTYINNSFMSTSLFIDTAMNFTSNIDKEKRYIQRINIKNNSVIFLQFISSFQEEYEILLPINSRLYIEYPFREMRIYNMYDERNENIICEEEALEYKVMDNILKNPDKIEKYE